MHRKKYAERQAEEEAEENEGKRAEGSKIVERIICQKIKRIRQGIASIIYFRRWLHISIEKIYNRIKFRFSSV